MDFLKIAIGAGVDINDLKGWSAIPIGQVQNSAEVAAIVVKNSDAAAKEKANELKAQSDFPIPIIEVQDGISVADKQKIAQEARDYEQKKWCLVF